MYKGKYVATISVDFSMDDKKSGLLPFEQIKETVTEGGFTKMLCDLLKDEVDEDVGSFRIVQQYADFYKTDD